MRGDDEDGVNDVKEAYAGHRGILKEEADRLRSALTQTPQGNTYDRLYAAQQALVWAIDPGIFKAPFDFIIGNPEGGSYLIPGNRADEIAKDDLDEETDGAEQNDTQAAQPASCTDMGDTTVGPAPNPTSPALPYPQDQVADSDGGDDFSNLADDDSSAESDPDDND